jgi:hypothetical protein
MTEGFRASTRHDIRRYGRPTDLEGVIALLGLVAEDLNDVKVKENKNRKELERAIGPKATAVAGGGLGVGAGGRSGSPLTVRTVDRSVSVPGVGMIELKQNDGFKLSSPATSVARVGAEIPTVIVTVVASEDLGGFVAVTSGGNLANSANIAHRGRLIGVTLGAIAADSSGAVAKEGRVENPAWSWSTDDILYLNGTSLSTVAPSTGFSQVIGVALNATTIIVRLGVPILL